tara:strand:- start:4306 stop:4683 length:378 start_codon:yes stop_codon:yes gene_type:complete
MINEIILIIFGVLILYYIYNNLTETIENYVANQSRLNFYKNSIESMNDINTHIDNTSVNLKGEGDQSFFFDTILKKIALANAIKIMNIVNQNTQYAINLYDVCFKDGNPCNKDCLEINSNFCFNN